MAQNAWLVWLIVGIVLTLAEMLVSGFVIIYFGVGALAAAAVAAIPGLRGNVPAQFAVFILVSLVLLFSTRKIVARIYGSGSNVKVGSDWVVGKPAVVMETIAPHEGKGLVRVSHDQWRAETEDGSIIEKGEKVDVIRVEGTRVIVKKSGGPEAAAADNQEA